MTLPILSFLLSFIRQKVWIYLNPRQGTATFRSPSRKGEEGKGDKRELLRKMEAGCTGKQILCLERQGPVLFHADQTKRVHLQMPSLGCCWQSGSYLVPQHTQKTGCPCVTELLHHPLAPWGTRHPAWSETKLSCGMLDTECDPVLPACPGNKFLWCAGTGAPVPPAGMATHGGNPLNAPFAAGRCNQCHVHVPALGKWSSGAGRSNTRQGNVGAGRATRNAPSAPPAPWVQVQAGTFLAGNGWQL